MNALATDPTRMWTWLIVPVSQTIHTLGVAAILLAATALNLRLLGVAGQRRTFAQMSAALMPWFWGGFIALLLTGTVQTIAEPVRELSTLTFGIKLILLVVVMAITATYASRVKKDPNYWECSSGRKRSAHRLALLSLFLWMGIATAGRLIAYA